MSPGSHKEAYHESYYGYFKDKALLQQKNKWC